jgi:hypothetical protein
MNDLIHSEEFVLMFLGYVCADLPELSFVEIPKMQASWEKFKAQMGKTGIQPSGSR